jgi:ABC-type transport system substrate-binding protein
LSFGLHTRTEDGNYGKGNYAHYSNPKIDQITEENLRVLDAKSRLEMLQSAMKTINEDIPYLPLLNTDDVYVVSKRIKWSPPATGELRVRDITYR